MDDTKTRNRVEVNTSENNYFTPRQPKREWEKKNNELDKTKLLRNFHVTELKPRTNDLEITSNSLFSILILN